MFVNVCGFGARGQVFSRGWCFAEDFYLKTILEQIQACLSAQRCHGGHSHALREYMGLAAIVWHAVCSRKQRWNGVPPLAGPLGRRRFFRRFSAHFLPDSGTPIFKTPKCQRKISGKSARKSAQKSDAPKNCTKICAKTCAPKICAKMGAKICAKIIAPKNCERNRFEHSVFWKMEARKKNLRQIYAKPQPRFSVCDSINKAFWYVSNPGWIRLGYVSMRTCLVFGSGSQGVTPLSGTPLTIIPGLHLVDVLGIFNVFPSIRVRESEEASEAVPFGGSVLLKVNQKLANGYFANGYFENPGKVPWSPPVMERKGGKRWDHSGKNMQPANSLKNVLLSCALKLKVPVYKVPVCEPSSERGGLSKEEVGGREGKGGGRWGWLFIFGGRGSYHFL